MTISESIFEASKEVIPAGVNSPVRCFPEFEMTPLVAKEGRGDLVVDADGREFVDFCCSWGALILGHAHPAIVEAATRQVERGSSFGITTEIEQKLASLIVDLIPSVEKIRFVSSGTEATMTALRLARGYTGRPAFIKFDGCYHGHSDQLLSGKSAGVSADPNTITLPYDDIETARKVLRSRLDIASVILEPIAGNMGLVEPSQEFIEMLRSETKRSGALLIFDEVITGFRVGLQGAQEYFGVEPDLVCYGKIIGGGFNAAAVGGPAEIMDYLAPLGPVYQAGTLSGNPVAMQAGYATLKELSKPGFYETLQEKVDRFLAPLPVKRVGSMFGFDLDRKTFNQLFLYLFDRGIYISPSVMEINFISSAHSEKHLNKAQDAILSFFAS